MQTYIGPMFICKNPSKKILTYNKDCSKCCLSFYNDDNFCRKCGAKLTRKKVGSDFKRKLDPEKDFNDIVFNIDYHPYDTEKKLCLKKLDIHQVNGNYFIDLYVPNLNKEYVINDETISFRASSLNNKFDDSLYFKAQKGYGLLSDVNYTDWLYDKFRDEYAMLIKYYDGVKLLDGSYSVVISYGIF